MLMDIHKDLGSKTRVGSIEQALEQVRRVWPNAGMEGSTGFQRSFWVPGPDGMTLVAHCWEMRGRDDQFWLRIRSAG